MSVAFTLFLAGCFYRPEPLIRLKPAALQNWVWQNGSEMIETNGLNSSTYLNFIDSNSDEIVFSCRIVNTGNETLTVDPVTFNCHYTAEGKKPVDLIFGAIDPQAKIMQVDKQIASERAKYKSQVGSDNTLVFFDLIGSFADIFSRPKNDHDRDDREKAAEKRREQAEKREDEQKETLKRIEHLEQLREDMKNSLLQTSTVQPGESVTGYIIFPRVTDAKRLELHLYISGELVSFRFDQELIQVN